MIIQRKEAEQLKERKTWLFVFGRRKTGKSFLVKNFIKWDDFFFVKRDKTILSESGESISYETFINILRRELNNNKTIVVDEFHRLGADFLDVIHALNKKGRLIVISSTLYLSKNLLGSKSPILGLFSEFPVRIIGLDDVLKALKNTNLKFTKKELLENAIILKEPIAISYLNESKTARKILAEIFLGTIKTVPALVGEIFLEEEKTLSSIYEGILRAVAQGKIVSTEIASYLFSKQLISNNDASMVQQYLKNLMDFGIIKKIEVYNKNKFIYKIGSPLINLFYYADEKYNISEREITAKEAENIIDNILPKIVEDVIREFAAKKTGLTESVIEEKDYDIDACLLKFKKPEIVIEVKWKSKIEKEEILKAEANLGKINAKKKILFVQDKKGINSSLEVMDVEDLLKNGF
ncbi:hypothetical protein A3K73_00490 [Candidatus Pacearchaeota archaeon RBG_13_36_9]|nr:MAG: hypothetical protein A3K73_00490 [Candidatus Pacearchaeota archaeon RBG_13_36_9]